ncbi:MAG: DUF1684 domain-containing protein [Ignavibacteria bacterium]|jgi:uncharacterized protein (DUF1684 family)|nr:DUF1684 domain-containing protein [Ignavibacteria bacterium]MCU7498391.1 DUF1684 domain-containing protein [Ignavibacteria bacterium]MCU7511933.1 DUF1684 domain-containing protein [Ignavibacteria bacterium]MCU7520034.1 DUF1684 domain-containing protein [Ignavibacteria bacterium]MCU7523108.1 DUF1684 domain-containing protein [Ignavibacteria bacterium]
MAVKFKSRYILAAALILASALVTFRLGVFSRHYTPEEKRYIAEVENMRQKKDHEMQNDPQSPFNFKGKVHFEPLKYFDVDPSYVFKSKLYEYENKDTVTVFGTKGEPRKAVRFGYISFISEGRKIKMNVYKGVTRTGQEYYSIWFTDRTTNNESYGVGRYLDFEKVDNPDYIYTIDFNQAYNPYCAYSPNYSCAVPTKDDYVDIEIKAGEKKFHN